MTALRSDQRMTVRFWGVRGSIAAPLTGAHVEAKVARALQLFAESSVAMGGNTPDIPQWMREHLPFGLRSTFGGNTTCIEVRCDGVPIILDMGTGLRELGLSMMEELKQTPKLRGYVFQSHVHWDHIQGFPFWKPLFLPRKAFDTRFTFYGGKSWDAQLETVLAGQMNAPVFPVNLAEIRETGMEMTFKTVHDRLVVELPGPFGLIKVTARKLNHPQETFGYRIEYGGESVAFTTDHEPYARELHRPLVDLVRDVDVWVTDCQFTHERYAGNVDGVQRLGWGHSFPEYIAEVARTAQPGQVFTMHHDQEADDDEIARIAAEINHASGIQTRAAFEGLAVAASGERQMFVA